MRISAINSTNVACTKSAMYKSKFMCETLNSPIEQPQQDTVNFKGIKGAAKGATVLGVLGAITGAVLSGGTSVIATAIYFGVCNGVVGASLGHHFEDGE